MRSFIFKTLHPLEHVCIFHGCLVYVMMSDVRSKHGVVVACYLQNYTLALYIYLVYTKTGYELAVL